MKDVTVTVLALEEPYGDGSGIEYGVRYDSSNDESLGPIEIHHVGEISWPVAKLDWLIDALSRVRSEIGNAQ